MGTLVVFGLGLLVVGWFTGILVLAFILQVARECGGSPRVLRATLVVCGAVVLTPSLIPGAEVLVTPLPLGALLLLSHSTSDLAFLLHTWSFLVPSMLATAALCWCIARWLFPNYSLKRTAASRHGVD
jgi:hypothetical protein